MKKLFTLTLLLAATLIAGAKTIYLNTGGASLWNQANAKFAVWHWQGSNGGAWSPLMTNVSSDVFQTTIDDAADHVIFVRMSDDATEGNWDKKWNQTNDLTLDGNLYTITGWGNDKSEGNWSTYSDGGNNPGTNPGTNPGGNTQEGNPRYYYKGYIDNEDVEPTDATLFEGGMAQLTVLENAYIFVLFQVDGQQGVQYMTASYVDGPTHATLLTTGSEKMHVGKGQYTLYLYDNGNGTLELSTQPIAGKTLVSGAANAIEDIQADAKAAKVMRDGKVYIVRDGVSYDMLGRIAE